MLIFHAFYCCFLCLTYLITLDSLQLNTRYGLQPVKIAADRYVLPGDYIVHEKYGVGQYMGVKNIHINPGQREVLQTQGMVVQFADTELTWFEKLAPQELYLFTSYENGKQNLNTALNTKLWEKNKADCQKESMDLARKLSYLMALRNTLIRIPYTAAEEEYKRFERGFKYTPTPDQLNCFRAIAQDMINSTRPMDRLICGDVGFGKTEVAARAIYRAILNNRQVALLAPTRLLASQHVESMKKRLPNACVRLLTAAIGKAEADKVREEVLSGKCQLVIGTQSLLSEKLKFHNLGMLVIDEEQRFGVEHKEKLKTIASGVDILTLTATPIPRTLRMATTALKDMTMLQSPPPNRKAVEVYIHKEDYDIAADAIERELNRGGQCFVVVPFIKNMEEVEGQLISRLRNMRLVKAHGRMSVAKFDRSISQFLNKDADVLLATTVVENGIDMPNVNTIVVLGSNQFGMASLYQLRGRVGRSDRQAYAYFMTNSSDEDTTSRLDTIKEHSALGSGFDIARQDLENRGGGKIGGTQQSGVAEVGTDLFNHYVKQSISKVKEEVILPITECHVRVNDLVDTMYEEIISPEKKETLKSLSISLQEFELAKEFVFHMIAAVKETLSVNKVKCDDSSTFDLEKFVFQFVTKSDLNDLDELKLKWYTHFPKDYSQNIEDLFLRRKLFLLGRKLAMSEISLLPLENNINQREAYGGTFTMKLKDMSVALWKRVLSEIDLNLELLPGFKYFVNGNYVQFDAVHSFIECPHRRRRHQVEMLISRLQEMTKGLDQALQSKLSIIKITKDQTFSIKTTKDQTFSRRKNKILKEEDE